MLVYHCTKFKELSSNLHNNWHMERNKEHSLPMGEYNLKFASMVSNERRGKEVCYLGYCA